MSGLLCQLWLGLALLVAGARSEAEQTGCVAAMQSWIAEQHRLFPADRQQDPHKLLYFLHVPRTAGRTTHNCFLMPMTPPSKRCARSYDGNKYNISVPDCGLLSSHDDYSAMRQFPGFAAVYTSIREPLSRVLSTYEFAVELASRAAGRFVQVAQPSAKLGRVSTRNVWPWSYLAPFVEDDMVARLDATIEDRRHGRWQRYTDEDGQLYYFNKFLNSSADTLTPQEEEYLITEPWPPIDPYENELYMPLREYIQHEVPGELLHNGQTLQVLGLTNYSTDPQASELRACIRNDRAAAELALDLAQQRLRSIWHVGVYERLRPSLVSFAVLHGKDLGGRAYKSNMAHAFSYDGNDGDSEEKDFLDPKLPKTLDKVAKAIKKSKEQQKKDKAELEKLGQKRFQKGDDKPSRKESKLRKKLEDAQLYHDRLLEQEKYLKAGTKVRSRLEASGRARQLQSDEEHEMTYNVSENFARCESQAHERAGAKRRSSLRNAKRLDGVSPHFTRQTRAAVSTELQQAILNYNWMDVALHKLAQELSGTLIEKAHEHGPLPELPRGNARAKADAAARQQAPQASQRKDEL